MANLREDDERKNQTSSAAPCLACEALIPDALDEVLSETDRLWFDRHVMTCAACSEMVADAQRGAAWLGMLKTPRPEPSALLLSRILAETSGKETLTLVPARAAMQPAAATNVLPFRPRVLPGWSPVARLLETRLAMTAAMAFFSIALTLNLTGVRLHATDLRPGNIRNTWYQATAQAHRSYDNLRVVRVLTARVELLRGDAQDEGPVGGARGQDGGAPAGRGQDGKGQDGDGQGGRGQGGRGQGGRGQGGRGEDRPVPAKPEGSSRRESPASGTPLLVAGMKRVQVAGGLA